MQGQSNTVQLTARQRRVLNGLCRNCCQPRGDSQSTSRCAACLAKVVDPQRRKVRREARVAQGLCPACGSPAASGRQRCEDCAARAHGYPGRTRPGGACRRCGNIAASVRQTDYLCRPCWFRVIAQRRTGSADNAAMLQSIFDEQNGRCAYTGEPLTPGLDASLDHRMPVSRGGTNERANLQWVTRHINVMKRDIPHEEFVVICRRVAQFHAVPEM